MIDSWLHVNNGIWHIPDCTSSLTKVMTDPWTHIMWWRLWCHSLPFVSVFDLQDQVYFLLLPWMGLWFLSELETYLLCSFSWLPTQGFPGLLFVSCFPRPCWLHYAHPIVSYTHKRTYIHMHTHTNEKKKPWNKKHAKLTHLSQIYNLE